jgi:Flp pilus assembly protein TadD
MTGLSRSPAGLPAAALIVAGTVLLFLPLLGAGFLSIDDPIHVTGNRHVREGITAEGAAWAFTTLHGGSYMPLTWLSHMLDVEWFGLSPRGPHGVNLLLHGVNGALLFLLLRGMTGAPVRSAVVAVLFAVHPLHVESFAWVSERKDVLCAAFSLLSLLAWLDYAREPKAGRYALSALLFAAALLSKPMAVTVPLLMLLLDRWPPGRKGVPTRLLLLEKAPLFALSAAASILALLGQSRAGALQPFPPSAPARAVGTALLSLATCLRKLLLPVDLAVYYPFRDPATVPSEVAAAAALLAAISALAWRWRVRRPWFAFGWLWFLAACLPVAGFVRVGEAAFADRYAYLPSVGLFVAAAWGGGEAAGRLRIPPAAAVAAAILAAALLGQAARVQSSAWHDDERLYRQAVRAVPGNWFALNGLGVELVRQGRTDEAIACYREALRAAPTYASASSNLGIALVRKGAYGEAERYLRLSLAVRPENGEALNALGIALRKRGSLDEAERAYREAIRLAPEDRNPRWNLALLYLAVGRGEESARELVELLRRRPGDAQAEALLRELGGGGG